MTAVLTALVLAITGVGLDLPPEIDTTAVATEVAVRVEVPPPAPVEDVAAPPPPAAPAGMSNCDEMHWYRQRAGLPARFDALGWRESNCRNEDGVRTYCCYGWWQLNVGLHLRDHRLAGRYHQCGVYSYADVNSDTPGDKLRQACAAKALFDVVGYSAWAL